MNRRFIHIPMFLLLLISSVAAFWMAYQRYRVEERNRAVEIVLDYNDVSALAVARRQSVSQFLESLPFRPSVALMEGSLNAWGIPQMTGDGVTFIIPDELFHQTSQVLVSKTNATSSPPAESPFILVRSAQGRKLYVQGEPEVIKQIELGLNPLVVEQIRAVDCRPVARLSNFTGAIPATMKQVLANAKRQGAHLIIFAGDQVLGFREGLQAAVEAFRELDLLYGSIEFGKQAGDSTLARALWDRTIRVHSVSASEAAQYAPPELIDRYVRAAQERNIRALYVRFPGGASAGNLLQEPIEYLSDLKKALELEGLTLKETGAHPFDAPDTIPWLYPLIGMGVGALGGWLLACWWAAPRLPWLPPLLPLLGAAVLAAACLTLTGRKGTALLAALTFPTVGMITIPALKGKGQHSAVGSGQWAAVEAGGERRKTRGGRKQPSEPRTPNAELTTSPPLPTSYSLLPIWLSVLVLLPPVLTWSLLGALHIVGLLNDGFFLIQADQFLGVKLAHALPLVAVGLIYALYVTEERAPWYRWLSQPVFWWQGILGVVVLGVLGVMLIRTGNEAPGAVSGIELRFRAILEQVLSVRPRTKEFLIGYPALMLAVGLLLTNRRSWLPFWMMVAAIGQVSLVNTFCHLHSPLTVSLLRTGWSILFGVIIGTIALGVWQRFFVRTRPSTGEQVV